MTLSGLKSATFQLAAQHVNHLCYSAPQEHSYNTLICDMALRQDFLSGHCVYTLCPYNLRLSQQRLFRVGLWDCKNVWSYMLTPTFHRNMNSSMYVQYTGHKEMKPSQGS
jgi:hypothetical protein